MEGQDVVTPKRKRTLSSVFNSGRSSRSSRGGFTVRTRRVSRRGVTRRASTKTQSLNKVAATISHPSMKVFANNGFTMNLQYANSLSANTTAAGIVHSTCPMYYMRVMLFASLARKIFNYWGWKINDWNEVPSLLSGVSAPSNVGTGDNDVPSSTGAEYFGVTLYWRYKDTNPLENAVATPVVYNGESFYTYVYKLMNKWYDSTIKYVADGSTPDGYPNLNLIMVRAFKRVPTSLSAGSTDMYRDFDIQSASVTIAAHSVMKFQNRSKTTSGDNTTDDIDLLPLVGKSYTGNGNGPVLRVNETNNSAYVYPPFTTSYLSGFRQFTVTATGTAAAPGVITALQKPPAKSAFKRVTSSGASALAPAEIDNSVLKYSGTKKFNVWLKLLTPGYRPKYYDVAIAGVTNAYAPVTSTGTVGQAYLLTPLNDYVSAESGLGKFRMFMWEKQINSIAVDTVGNQISVHYEHDLKLGSFMKISNKKFTQTYDVKGIVQSI